MAVAQIVPTAGSDFAVERFRSFTKQGYRRGVVRVAIVSYRQIIVELTLGSGFGC